MASLGSASPTTLPPRSTVMRSATASTSRSLWVMKMIDLPWSMRLRTTAKKSSTSPGVSTAVGSSRIRMSASRKSALTSSTRCCSPTERSSTMASGSMCEAVARRQLADARAGAVEVEQRALAHLVAEDDVLDHREHGDELEVLVHHADPVGDGVAPSCRTAPARPAGGSGRRRAGRARTRCSSACSCRRRSRRAGSGPHPRGA